jgi:hypothetical protein
VCTAVSIIQACLVVPVYMEPGAKNNGSGVLGSVLVFRSQTRIPLSDSGATALVQDVNTGCTWQRNKNNDEDVMLPGGKTPGDKTMMARFKETRPQTENPRDFSEEILAKVKQALSQNHLEGAIGAMQNPATLQRVHNAKTGQSELIMVIE